jgi:hypothetical protein
MDGSKMTKHQRNIAQVVEEFKADCKQIGWIEDKNGNLSLQVAEGNLRRLVFKNRVVRYEYRDSEGNWNRLYSAKLEEAKVINGKLVGFKR